ncbi:MAG: hypothetical protein V2B19_08280 [Pseudomonadota bacterium]
MKSHKSSKKDRKKEHKGEKEKSDLCCSFVKDPCGYAYDSCGNAYVSSCCCS